MRRTSFTAGELPSAISTMSNALNFLHYTESQRKLASNFINICDSASLSFSQLISEIAGRIPTKTQQDFSFVNWRGVVDYRNRTAHSTSLFERHLVAEFLRDFAESLKMFIDQYSMKEEG